MNEQEYEFHFTITVDGEDEEAAEYRLSSKLECGLSPDDFKCKKGCLVELDEGDETE